MQATPGASLTPKHGSSDRHSDGHSDRPSDRPNDRQGDERPSARAEDHRPAVPSRGRCLTLFAIVAIVCYATDVATKVLAVELLTGRAPVPVVGEVLSLYLTYNSGAAFSFLTGFTEVLTVIAVAAALGVLWFARRLGSTGWALGLGFLLGGVLGNLTDRLVRDPGFMRGHVVDFFMLPDFPVFNVADICINLAAGTIILQAVRGIAIDGTRHDSTRRAEEPTADPEDPER